MIVVAADYAGLAAGTAVVLGIGLWLIVRKAIQVRCRVPSLRLVSREPPKGARGIIPPWWLILCLLGLALAAVGAMQPWTEEEAEARSRTVFVVGTGIESLAREGSSTRLSLSKGHVMDRLSAFDSESAQFLLLAAGRDTEVVVPWTASKAEIESGLARLEGSAVPAEWPAAFDLALSLGGGEGADLVLVGSRVRAAYLDWAGRLGTRAPVAEVVHAGLSRPNRGIHSLSGRVRSGPDGEVTRLDVIVAGTGPSATAEWLTKWSGLEVTSNREPVEFRTAGSTVVPMSLESSADGFYETVRLEVPGRHDRLEVRLSRTDPEEALTVDDRAEIHFRSHPRVLLWDHRAEKRNKAAGRLRAALPGSEIEVAAGPPTPESLEGFDILVASREDDEAAAAPSTVNTLLYAAVDRCGPATFVNHDPSSPLTRGLNVVAAFELKARDVPESLRPVAFAQTGGRLLGVVGVSRGPGARTVSLGYDWVEGNLRDRRALAIMLVNALDWLSPRATRPGAVWAGRAYPFQYSGDATELVLERPDGALSPVPAARGRIDGSRLTRAGTCLLRADDGFSLTFAVNARFADLRVEEPAHSTHGTPEERPAAVASSRRYTDRPWWIAAMALLLMEVFAYLFRPTSRGAVKGGGR